MILDAAQSQSLKERGQQIAMDFSGLWRDAVVDEFRGWVAIQKARGLTWITIEQFRSQARSHPDSHKAWGALPRILVAAGLIRPTGEYIKAAAPKTHAHPVAKWRIA